MSVSSLSSTNVRHPSYRQNNLGQNGIRVLRSRDTLPNQIASHVESMRSQRTSPGPSSEDLERYLDDVDALAEGCNEADVDTFFADSLLPKASDPSYGRASGLIAVKSSLVSSHLIPANPASQFRVSQPKPDYLYGYTPNQGSAFTDTQLTTQGTLHPKNCRYPEATTQGLRFPFFTIELKAAGGTKGDLWVAVNQCAGTSSACLAAIGRLNTLLKGHEGVRQVDSMTYSIVADNNTAQLYISWAEEPQYNVQQVDAFLLSRKEDLKKLHRMIRNILDWGKEERLMQIKMALDVILEVKQKEQSVAVKSRAPPSTSMSALKRRRASRQIVPAETVRHAADRPIPDPGPTSQFPCEAYQDHVPHAVQEYTQALAPPAEQWCGPDHNTPGRQDDGGAPQSDWATFTEEVGTVLDGYQAATGHSLTW